MTTQNRQKSNAKKKQKQKNYGISLTYILLGVEAEIELFFLGFTLKPVLLLDS